MEKWVQLLVVLLLCACTSGVKDLVQTFKVDPGHLSDKPFHEFFSLEEIIPLEATDSSAFSEILKVVAVKDRIFILPWAADKILSFSREGKFIRSLDQKGRAPGRIPPVPTMPSALFQDRGEYSYIAPLTQNVIYRYDSQKDTLLPAFSFDIKNHPVPAEPIRKNDRQPFFYDYYFLNCEYIGKKTVVVSAYCLAKTELLTLVCDQKGEKAYPFPYIWEDKANELTLQRYFQQTGFDGNLLTFTRPLQVLERNYQDKNSPGHKLSQKVTEEDNPILLVYKEI